MVKFVLAVALVLLPVLLPAQDYSGTVNGIGLRQFYAWWMLLTGTIFSFVFFLLWKMKSQEKTPKPRIEGILWFAAALGVWGLSGLADLLVLQPISEGSPGVLEILCRSLFSSLNSVFILFTIPSIEIPGAKTGPILKGILAFTKNKLSVVVAGIVFMLFTLFLYWLLQGPLGGINNASGNGYLLYVPDILFSLLTILTLLFVLRTAFNDPRRHMSAMVWVVYITIILTTLAEVSLIFPLLGMSKATLPDWLNWLETYPASASYYVFYDLVATVFKMLLIALFVILLYSYEIKKAAELQIAELLSLEEIRQRWGLEEREVLVLRRLAKGDTREAIGSDMNLFLPRTNPRKNVDDLLQNKIAPKLRLANREVLILLFALQNKIIQFDNSQEDNFTDNITGDHSADD